MVPRMLLLYLHFLLIKVASTVKVEPVTGPRILNLQVPDYDYDEVTESPEIRLAMFDEMEDLLEAPETRVVPVTGRKILEKEVREELEMNETRRVISGNRANVGDIPYLVSFRYLKKKGNGSEIKFQAFCGGTLVTPIKVISAAHCFEKFAVTNFFNLFPGYVSHFELEDIRAVAGSVTNLENLDSPESAHTQWRFLNNAWYPSSYKFPANDVAVVILMQKFEMTHYVHSINYSTQHSDFRGSCLAAGFGRTNYFEVTPTKYMYKAELELMPEITCSKLMRRSMHYFICTNISATKTDVAQGDSGGPLVCKNTKDPREDQTLGILIGIVSAGVQLPSDSGEEPTRVTLFSRTASHRAFIAKNGSHAHGMPGNFTSIVLPASLGILIALAA